MALVGSLYVEPVHAQEPPARYRELFTEATEELAAGRFEEGHILFLQAHALHPNARSHRALGLVLFELRQYIGAVEHLRASLMDTRRPLSPRLRSSAEDVLRRASRFVGVYSVRTSVAGAVVEVDGHRREALIVLSPGLHTLRVSATGYLATERQLRVLGGEDEVLDVTLRRSPDPESNPYSAAPIAPAERRPAAVESAFGHAWTMVGSVSTVLVFAAAVAVGTRARNQFDELRESCGGTDVGCPQGDINEVGRRATIANVLFGVAGALLAGTGLAMYLEFRRASSRPQALGLLLRRNL